MGIARAQLAQKLVHPLHGSPSRIVGDLLVDFVFRNYGTV
jgi:hypothetical protein